MNTSIASRTWKELVTVTTIDKTTTIDLVEVAGIISGNIDEYFPARESGIRQVLCLAEEAWEFVAAYRRATGMARRHGSMTEVETELADVVITAYVTAHVLGIDLTDAITNKLTVIFTRGWKQPPPTP
jgi:NTP pyrophosphatase (non-canonical NTP hydrolase)